MSMINEGRLRLIRAAALISFFFAVFILLLSYAFLQEQIVVPGWHLVSAHYPTKSGFFFSFLGIFSFFFFLFSMVNARLKRFPASNQLSASAYSGSDLKQWGAFLNSGIFVGLNLLFMGAILKIWQLNNPDMNALRWGFNILLLLSFLVILYSIFFPFYSLTKSK